VIYTFIVVYSFYWELKGMKTKEDMPDTTDSGKCVTPPGNSTSPSTPPKTTEENIYQELPMHTARNKLRSDSATAEEGEVYAIYDYTLPNQNVSHFT
jgi:hypothetical protein